MRQRLQRRTVLAALTSLPVLYLSGCAHAGAAAAKARFAALEQDLGGRLGVAALDTGSGRTLGYRQHERFPLCSTFKVVAAAAVLARSADDPGFLQRRVHYTKDDVIVHSPVTARHVRDGMTLEQLCAATVIHSDNAAANLILRQIGGPEGLTRFARSIGDPMFRLDRWETALNTALPGDPRDTTTPAAMTATLDALVLGGTLPGPGRDRLTRWMIDCATGAERIRAGIPAAWKVGDKTGTGGYGSAHDVGVLWPVGRAPIVLSVYTVRDDRDGKARSDIVAAAARLVAGQLAGQD